MNHNVCPRIMVAAWLLVASYPAAAAPVVSELQVPLAGTVNVPLPDGSFDFVSLTGFAHVVTQVYPSGPFIPPEPVRIKINLDQVKGTGDLTGLGYIAYGANRVSFPAIPTDPITLGYTLSHKPSDPNFPGDPMDITFLLHFSVDTGALSSVEILSMVVPVP